MYDLEPKRWTRAEYHHLGELGMLQGRNTELIEGTIYWVLPPSPRRATTMSLIHRALSKDEAGSSFTRTRAPLALGNDSEPEPDVTVVKGKPSDYAEEHPSMALLVAEISDGALSYIRERKQWLYACAGIPEFWIINLADRTIEIRREPRAGEYRSLRTLKASGTISPFALPDIEIPISSFLP